MSILNPPQSLGIGLASAALSFAVFSKAVPTVADIRVADQQNSDIESANRLALATSLGVAGAVSLLAKDATIFVIGGGTAVVLAWWHKHANMVNPATSRAFAGSQTVDMPPETEEQQDNVYAMPSY